MQPTIATPFNHKVMEQPLFNSVGGGMPALDKLPTLLQKSISLLGKLSCVAGVQSGSQQDDCSMLLIISFRDNMNYLQALACFKVEGLTVKYLNVNHGHKLMIMHICNAKSLLN